MHIGHVDVNELGVGVGVGVGDWLGLGLMSVEWNVRFHFGFPMVGKVIGGVAE